MNEQVHARLKALARPMTGEEYLESLRDGREVYFMGERVKDVRSSKRLTESAVCIVNDSMMDRTLEKLLSRQKDSGISVSAPILEVNPTHPLIKALAALVQAKGAASVDDAAQLLLDQAFIIEGEQVPDPANFAKRLADVMAKAFG